MSSESDGDDDEFAASLEQAMLAAANPPCRRDSDGSNTALGHTTGALHTDVSTTTHTGDDWAFGLPEEVILHGTTSQTVCEMQRVCISLGRLRATFPCSRGIAPASPYCRRPTASLHDSAVGSKPVYGSG
jgi:hypothetical protein